MNPSADQPPVLFVLVEPELDTLRSIEHELYHQLEACDVLRAGSAREACSLIEREPVELVFVQHFLPDGTSEDILQWVAERQSGVAVVVHLRDEPESVAERLIESGAAGYVRADEQGAYLGTLPVRLLEYLYHHNRRKREEVSGTRRKQQETLRAIRATVSHVYHEINNPLSIISGNAQLLLELGQAMSLEEDLMNPVKDIEEASRRVNELLREFAKIRAMVGAETDNNRAIYD